jgi:hypothetical protein
MTVEVMLTTPGTEGSVDLLVILLIGGDRWFGQRLQRLHDRKCFARLRAGETANKACPKPVIDQHRARGKDRGHKRKHYQLPGSQLISRVLHNVPESDLLLPRLSYPLVNR